MKEHVLKILLNDYGQHVFLLILMCMSSGSIVQCKVALNTTVCQNVTAFFSFSKYNFPQPFVK